ncbi:DUF1467 family protein [Alkalilacustris brevis]|uniref:DUF1467 family protein n=1 Tax=Alkalilacustris brevis TaxID=2026338 RepID=UPI000E0D9119|nr:DUF1467 family protein [Alkalilacustris brevis]
MTIMSGFVLFAVFWFLALFIVLPLRLTTQEEANETVPGTPSSAPVDPHIRQKVKLATIIALVCWGIAAFVLINELVTVADIDIFNRLDSDLHRP